MEKKNIKIFGFVCVLFGSLVSLFGKFKYDSANTMYKTASYFGENKTSDRWDGYMSNYKIFIIVGLIVLLIGVIILISGFISSNTDSQMHEKVELNTSIRLVELQKMLDDRLITQDEFEQKRKQIIDSF